MSAATLSALVFGLALPLCAEPAPAANPALPSKQDVLSVIFQEFLTPEQATKMEEPSTAERMAAVFTPQQKAGAKASLSRRAAAAKDADELVEIGRGFLILGDPQGLVEAGAQAAQRYPGESGGFTMMGHGLVKLGEDGEALAVVNRALELNPNDDGARGLRVLIESRRQFGGRGAATPTASAQARTIEAAMISVPNSAAYKAAVGMSADQGSAVAGSARRALSDLRPTASRHIPLDLAHDQESTPEGPVRTPRGAAMAAAAAAAVTVGSVILFLGLLPKRLDQDYPWLKPSMTGGMLLAGAFISYDLMASHFLFGSHGAAWTRGGQQTASTLAGRAAAGGSAATTAAQKGAPAAGGEAATLAQQLPRISMTSQTQAEAQSATQEGAEAVRQIVIKRGQVLGRVWDSRHTTKDDGFSGPKGSSFCLGACSPINAQSAIDRRGLNIPGVVNNAQKGGLFRVEKDIVVRVRQSIGGVEPEILVDKADLGKLIIISEYPIPPGR